MQSFLRQSTASQSRSIGPFVDDTDFKTAETALTIANTDIKLVVAGGASADKNSGGGTHRVNGVYGITFDATDTATVGEMLVSVVVAGALPVFHKFWVLEEAAYDALFAASAPGYVANAPVNVAQWSGTNVAAVDTAGYPKVTVKAGTGTGELDLSAGALKIRTILKQNVGFRLPFTMKDSTGAPLTGSTVTVTRSINGAAFGASTAGTATELANGWYYLDLSNGDVNGTNIALRMAGSGGSGTPVDNAMTLLMEP